MTWRPPLWSLVFLAYLLLTLALTWPLAVDLGGHIYGHAGGDGIGGIAYFDTWKSSILGGHPGLDPSLTYPFGDNLRANPVPPLYFAVGLLLTFVLGSIVTYNLLAFLSFPLSAMGGYVLARVLRLSPAPAFAAGAFSGFSAYHAAHAAGHTTLPHTEFFPLVLVAVLLWRRKGGIVRALVVVLAISLTLTWDYYFAIFVMLMLGATIVSLLVSDSFRGGVRHALLRAVQTSALVALAAAAAMPFFLLIKSGLQNPGVDTRSSVEVLIFSAQPCQVLQPWIKHPELSGLACGQQGLPPAEIGLYVGASTLILAAVLVVTSIRRGLPGRTAPETWLMVPISVVGVAWAVPTAWQHLVHTSPPAILWNFIPGLRVSSRSIVLLQMGLAILAGAGLERLLSPCPARRTARAPRTRGGAPGSPRMGRRAWAVAGVITLLFCFESLGISAASDPLPHPAVYDWLARQPRSTLIMQYPPAWPGTYSEGTGYFYAFYHARHQLREIGTTLGATNEGMDLAAELWGAGAETAGELRTMGVRYAVSHTGIAYDLRNSPDVLRGLPGLRPVWSGEGDTVYEVTAPPQPFAYLTGDFQVLEQRTPTGYARWMGASGRIALENPYDRPISALLHLDGWCIGGDCRDRVGVRGDGADQHLTASGPDPVRVTMPPGRSYVELVPPNPPRKINAVEERKVTLYVFRPSITMDVPAA